MMLEASAEEWDKIEQVLSQIDLGERGSPPPPVSWFSQDALALVPLGQGEEAEGTSGWAPLPHLGSLCDSDCEGEGCTSSASVFSMFADSTGNSSVLLVANDCSDTDTNSRDVLKDPEVTQVLDARPLDHSFQGVSKLAKGRVAKDRMVGQKKSDVTLMHPHVLKSPPRKLVYSKAYHVALKQAQKKGQKDKTAKDSYNYCHVSM